MVGEGWHERAGGPHAEVCALQLAADDARGATAYVSLEPCAAQGRTPPCTAALLEAGIARVIYAVADPTPQMQGGAAKLREAGVQVEAGLLAAEARELNVGFFSRFERQTPWVRVKLGASLDGRTALANGQSRWITSPQARADVQLFRARSSVVLTGAGTVLADDPILNVRLEGASRQPLRAILDSQLRVPATARVYGPEASTLVFTASDDEGKRERLQQRGVRVERAPGTDAGLELQAVLARLAELGMNEVWVEAGAQLSGAFLAAQLADELVIYLAPSLLGPQARPLALLPELERLEDCLPLRFESVQQLGPDLRIIARRATAARA